MPQITDWMPSRMADQLTMFLNILAKINAYEPILPLTSDQVKRIKLICEEFIAIYNYVEQCQATTKSLTEWRDLCWKGSPVNDPAPAPPTYPTYNAVADSFIGILIEFRELRDIIVSSPGYTLAIGEDLMIVGTPQANAQPQDTAPSLKVVTSNNYAVKLSGSMQGMDAMRVEYYRKGSNTWQLVGYFTKMPGELTITPHVAGEPESGNIRAMFIKKNADFGNYSPEYAITVSE